MVPDDERGQSIQIGAVLLFGALVLALAGYQAFVVPAQNERVEFSHSQTVQGHMSELRNAIVSAPGGGGTQSVSVQLGTEYPGRVLGLNPGRPTGQLRTAGTDDPSVEFSVRNAEATGETGDFWDGSGRSYRTGGLVYRPNYNVYSDAPTTAYENSVLSNEFGSDTVALSDQTLVDGTRITLVALNGSYGATQSGTVSPDVRPVSSSTRTVTVSDDGDPIELTMPTKLDEDTWEELLDEEVDSGHVVDGSVSVTDTGGEFETLSLELETGQQYTLQMAKVGVGTDVTETDEAYMTNVSKSGSTVPEDGSELLVVEVRDEYNNPVSGVTVSADAVAGSLDDTTARTGPEGRAAFLYEAPASVSSRTEDTVEFSYTGAPGTGFDAAEPENVNMTVEIQSTAVGGSAGDVPYSVTWDDPDGGSNDRYEFDVDTEGSLLDMTALVENTSLTNATIDGAEVDFAVNDSTVATVSPGTDTSGSNGEATTTLTAQSNGTVRVYAVTGGGASDYLDVNVSGVGAGSDTIIDNFEDADIDEYGDDVNQFSTTTNPTFDGSYALQSDSIGNAIKYINTTSAPANDLPEYPREGDTFNYNFYPNSFSTNHQYKALVGFGETSGGKIYEVSIDETGDNTGNFELTVSNGDGSETSDSTFDLSTGTWYEVEVEWGTDDVVVTLTETDGTELASVTVDGKGDGGADELAFGNQGGRTTFDYVRKTRAGPATRAYPRRAEQLSR